MADLFAKLPFAEAIRAFKNRRVLPKGLFEEIERENKSRAFTMANVGDESILQSIFEELGKAIESGETVRGFTARLSEISERTGWTGTSPWHHRLVYHQNAQMAYSAGRMQQGVDSGLRVWRYLPSLSDEPRPDHEQYYGNLYRFEPGSALPPIDFNCLCRWEWVFPRELESMGIDPAGLPVFDPPKPRSGFEWSPAHYSELAANAETQTVPSERWVDLAVGVAAGLSAEKFRRLSDWMLKLERAGMSLSDIQSQLADARAIVASEDEAELNHLVTFAALLRGREAVEAVVLPNSDKLSGRIVVCEAALLAPKRFLLIPWGKVKGLNGASFVMNEQAARMTIDRFVSRGLDVPIDEVHRTVKAEDDGGTAPAVGWIKRLDSVPGRGVFADVEWTAKGNELVSSKSYRYVSPALLIGEKDSLVIGLHSAGLVNRPNLKELPPLVNAEAQSKGTSMDWVSEIRALAERITTEGMDTAAIVAALNGLAASASEDAVSANAEHDGRIAKLISENAELRRQIEEVECDRIIQAHSAKVPPVQQKWFRDWFSRDKEAATDWIKGAPDLVFTRATAMSEDGRGRRRFEIISRAKTEFGEMRQSGRVVFCSEKAWVSDKLSEAGQPVLNEEEIKVHRVSTF